MFRTKRSNDPGHIKPRTQGTSNEISFSVLHAKSNAASQEAGSPARPMWELPQEELKARRTKRRRSRRMTTAAIAVCVIAAVAIVGSVIVVNVQRQLDHVAYMRDVLQQTVDTCDQLQPFNEAVSEALVQSIGSVPYSDIESKYETAKQQAPNVANRLRDLKSQIEEAQQYLTLPGDKEAANQGIAAINAQLNLLEMGEKDMEFALPAQKAYSDAREAVEDILHANDLAREATELMADMNAESAAASKAKSEECLSVLQSAYDKLQFAEEEVKALAQSSSTEGDASAEDPHGSEDGEGTASGESDPESTNDDANAASASSAPEDAASDDVTDQEDGIDVMPDITETSSQTDILFLYLEYTNLRIKAQEAAISSMQAYIDRDKATLDQANNTYNQLETQAAAMMTDQQLLPTEDVSAAFAIARSEASDQWSSELARTSVACSAVRDYLA